MVSPVQDSSWTSIKSKLHLGGPLILVGLGLIWTLQGFGMLPGFLDVKWLGLVLLSLGLLRVAMFFRGYY